MTLVKTKLFVCMLLALCYFVSPSLAEAPVKKDSAEKKLDSGTQKVVDNVMSFLPEVREAHDLYPDVPIAVVLTVIHIESGGEPDKVNKTSKAAGLMQIVPGPKGAYFKFYGLTPKTALDPRSSIMAGTKILHTHLGTSKEKWGGSTKYALAAYARGAGNISGTYPDLDAAARTYLKMYAAAAPLYKDVK